MPLIEMPSFVLPFHKMGTEFICAKSIAAGVGVDILHAVSLGMQTQLTSSELVACSQCLSWKKQIVRARHAAKVAGRQ